MSDDSKVSSITSLLQRTTVASLLQSSDKPITPITISSTASVTDACHVLASHAISSAPVYDAADHSFKGMLDYKDVCVLLARAYAVKGTAEFNGLLTADVQLTELMQHGLVGNAPVTLVTDLSLSNPLKGVHLTDSLWDVVKHFLENYHRVCVFDADGAFVGVISQSDIVKFVYEHGLELSSAIHLTLEELNLNKVEAVTLDASQPVLQAITLMANLNISSVALTDQHLLIGVLSISDIKYLVKKNRFLHLKESCADFISSVRQYQAIEERHGKDSIPVFSVHSSSTLHFALGRIVATRAHRVFVVDSGKRIGVVSLTDILRAIVA